MYRRARDLHAALKCRFVHMESIEAIAAEGRNQARMDVQNPVVIRMDDVLRQNRQEARQHNDINRVFTQQGQQTLAVILRCFALLLAQDGMGDSGGFRAGERIGGCV